MIMRNYQKRYSQHPSLKFGGKWTPPPSPQNAMTKCNPHILPPDVIKTQLKVKVYMVH